MNFLYNFLNKGHIKPYYDRGYTPAKTEPTVADNQIYKLLSDKLKAGGVTWELHDTGYIKVRSEGNGALVKSSFNVEIDNIFYKIMEIIVMGNTSYLILVDGLSIFSSDYISNEFGGKLYRLSESIRQKHYEQVTTAYKKHSDELRSDLVRKILNNINI